MDDYDDYDDKSMSSAPGGEDRVSKQVSSWFSSAEDDEIYDDYDDDFGKGGRSSRGRRMRRRQASTWFPINALDVFFGLDREELSYQEEQYNDKLGIGSNRNARQRASAKNRPRRQGYAYRIESDNDEEPPIADIDVTATPIEDTQPASVNGGSQASTGNREENDSGTKSAARERTWEERAMAMERIPPTTVPAWGPSGVLGVDARSKAISDAIEDIQTARQKLEVKEKKEALARENITILKV